MHRFKNAVAHFTDNISLKIKIQLVFFLFLIVPLLLFTLISYRKTNRLILTQTLSHMSQSYEESVAILERHFYSMSNATENLLSNQDLYPSEAAAGANGLFVQQARYKRIRQMFGYMQTVSDVDQIFLYVPNDSGFPQDDRLLLPFRSAEQAGWYQALLDQNASRFWLPPGYLREPDGKASDSFSYVSILYAPDSLTTPAGLLRVDISAKKIQRILQDAPFPADTLVCLRDQTGAFFTREGTIKNAGPAGIVPDASGSDDSDWAAVSDNSDWVSVRHEGADCLMRSAPLLPGWHLTVLLPRHAIFAAQRQLYRELLIGLLLIGLISYILACLTVNSSLKRLYDLNREIKKMEQGDFHIRLQPAGKDEIGEIMSSFLSMNRRMKTMIEERYQMGQAIKSAELHALQAQINPHFLYNSMDLINCIAIQKKVPQITEMATALVRFYKLGLSNGKDVVTLRQELLHVKTYVHILNIRFQDKIRFTCREVPWLDDYLIPKITLQPLAENAILHGILETESQTGRLDLQFLLHTDAAGREEIHILVRDDGVGMSAEKMKKILQENCAHPDSGYGVKNVNERLWLYFGPSYGLSYQSSRPGGTLVTVRIPAVRREG
ncbi:MAG: histidine kinase [Eubacteriales bacterium]|nr:histidine kinase [Eubacteriales bacterium]